MGAAKRLRPEQKATSLLRELVSDLSQLGDMVVALCARTLFDGDGLL